MGDEGSQGAPKGGVGRFLRGLIFEESPEPSSEGSKAAPAGSAEEAASPRISATRSSGVTARSKKTGVNPEILKELKDAVLAKPSLFTQFLDQLDTLSEAGLDESKQYVTALAILKKSAGATLRKILNAIDSLHAGILEGEKTSFLGQINQWVEENVGEQTEELKSVKSQIAAKKREIAKLQEEVTALETSGEKLEAKIAQQTEKVEARKEEFARSLEAAAEWLEEHKTKITTHLGGKGE